MYQKHVMFRVALIHVHRVLFFDRFLGDLQKKRLHAKTILVYKNIEAWHQICWQLCCQPTKGQFENSQCLNKYSVSRSAIWPVNIMPVPFALFGWQILISQNKISPSQYITYEFRYVTRDRQHTHSIGFLVSSSQSSINHNAGVFGFMALNFSR